MVFFKMGVDNFSYSGVSFGCVDLNKQTENHFASYICLLKYGFFYVNLKKRLFL